MYIYICICMYVCMYLYIYVYIYICICGGLATARTGRYDAAAPAVSIRFLKTSDFNWIFLKFFKTQDKIY